MKLLVTLGLLCAIGCAVQAQFPGGRGGNGRGRVGGGGGFKLPHRFRREPQGSLRVHGEQHLTGPDTRPSLDVNYQHQLMDNGRTQVNAFGGGHLYDGRVSPQAGLGFEHKFKNDVFLHGGAQVKPGHSGRLEPSFGASAGWRFRREAVESGPYEEEAEESQGIRVRREPQGSLVVEGQQPLSGPHRQPSLDINYQHQLIDDGRTKLNTFGGAHLQNGRVTPQAGLRVEHTFRNNMFVHGGGQVQPGHRGRLEPSFGAGLGWRFRRDAPYEEESVNEQIEGGDEE